MEVEAAAAAPVVARASRVWERVRHPFLRVELLSSWARAGRGAVARSLYLLLGWDGQGLLGFFDRPSPVCV